MSQSEGSTLSVDDYQRIEANQLGIPLGVYKLEQSYIRFIRRIGWLIFMTGIVVLSTAIIIGLIKGPANNQLALLFLPLLGGLYALFQGGVIYRIQVQRAQSERVIVCEQGLLQIKKRITSHRSEVVRWEGIQTIREAFFSRDYFIIRREGEALTLTRYYHDLDELIALIRLRSGVA